MKKTDASHKKIGVIGIPGKWSSEHIADIISEHTGFRLLISVEDIMLDVSRNRAYYNNTDLSDLDGIIIKKLGGMYSHHMLSRLDMLDFLHQAGIRMFSPPARIRSALDRLSCTLKLQKGGIPIPETVITERVSVAAEAVKRFGTAVLKPLFTSKARGMAVVEHGPDAQNSLEHFKAENTVMYIQKKVSIPGRDLGIVFLGGEYVGTYARVAHEHTWNTTTHYGGTYEPFTPKPRLIDLAHSAQSLFGLDFTCVDIAEAPEGPLVFEVSAFGGFRGLFEANKIDAARLYTEYVIRKLNHG